MYLVISKRFEMSLSFRYYREDWSVAENREAFGRQMGSEHGYGGNPTAYFVFDGPVDEKTGMLINVSIIKERVNRLLAERYDHKYLNRDTAPFDKIVPTPENIARQLFLDTAPLFDGESARLAVCHVATSPFDAATCYAGGRVERDYRLEFSAARRTCSPHLSDEENEIIFGVASSKTGHGHFYRLRVTLQGEPDVNTGMIVKENDCRRVMEILHTRLDHKNLNLEVPELRDQPMTTEYLARFLFHQLRISLPLARVRLWENPYFYAEYLKGGRSLMGVKTGFRAAHRLHSPVLDDESNCELYGKCNNPAGHGHLYEVEAAIEGTLDERRGIFYGLDDFRDGLEEALEPWHMKHLDLDSDDFKNKPSTGENIVRTLWPRLEQTLQHPLYRLRLWETPNNRFTLRREVEEKVS
ncbi:MAG: 6-carboxytetrahydropterin synthase [candidate division Zixibacteria bacterium]|nr:6-carboxytetrahydropterin synthase [candidate division Zixibacteria bacterium]